MTTGWVLWPTAAYALLAAAVQVSWWVAGDTGLTELVNLATVLWTLPALVLLVVALLLRSWDVAALLAVPAAILVWSYGGLALPGRSPTGPGDLRVASANVLFRAADVDHVVALVDDADPDVLLVQEVRSGHAAMLREQLGERLAHTWFGGISPGSFDAGSVGVLSRFPIAEVRPIARGERFPRPSAVVTLEVPDSPTGTLQVAPMHLLAPCPVCGGSVIARQAREARLHRDHTRAVLDLLDEDVPAVLGGDLNGTRRSEPYRMITGAGFRDPHVEAGTGLGLTFPDPPDHTGDDRGEAAGATPAGVPLAHLPLVSRPLFRFDWILARGLEPTRSLVGPARASDHRPVIVDLAWPDG